MSSGVVKDCPRRVKGVYMVPISFLYPAYMLFVFFVGKSYVAFPHLAGTDLAAHGCRSIELINLKTPEVSFVSLRAVEASVFEQRLEVRM